MLIMYMDMAEYTNVKLNGLVKRELGQTPVPVPPAT
jgi:hypothetical protein